MAKLQDFSGGLVTRTASHLIPVNSATTYSNIDSEAGSLKPVNSKSVTGEALDKFAFYFEAESRWVSSSTQTDYLEYRGALYTTDSATIPQRVVGSLTANLGIAAATVGVAGVISAGILTGTYNYVYTYYDTSTGAESAPNPVSADIVAVNSTISIQNIIPSTDPQVDKVRLYRVGGNLATFSLVGTYNNGTTNVTDNVADSVIPGDDLITDSYGQAIAGGSDIKEAYGVLWYTLKDKLYFSEVGKWFAWPAENFFDFELPVTGYGMTSRGILVFTARRTYLITGTTKATFSRTLLSSSQGCKHYKTVAGLGGGIVWVSNDGICLSDGGVPSVVSRQFIGKTNIQASSAVVHDDVYYLQLLDGSILAMDSRYKLLLKNFSVGTTWLITALDTLYGYEGGLYYELFAGDDKEQITWKSPVFLDSGYKERKSYKSIYVTYRGSITVSVYIDDNKVASVSLTGSDTKEVLVDQARKDGYSIQFVVTGAGEVLELSYTPVGRPRL